MLEIQIFKKTYFKISNFQKFNFGFFQNFKIPKFQITRHDFQFGVQKDIKLRQHQFHIKDIGKSSSRKLRRVIYYSLYRMDPRNTH